MNNAFVIAQETSVSATIPARFQIGFPLPADKHSAEIPGYHCWAEFYLDSAGWVPVDISEAWKHQEKHHYFLAPTM